MELHSIISIIIFSILGAGMIASVILGLLLHAKIISKTTFETATNAIRDIEDDITHNVVNISNPNEKTNLVNYLERKKQALMSVGHKTHLEKKIDKMKSKMDAYSHKIEGK